VGTQRSFCNESRKGDARRVTNGTRHGQTTKHTKHL